MTLTSGTGPVPGVKTVTDRVDGGVICKQYCGVRRKHRRKIMDKNREKSRTKCQTFRNTEEGKPGEE